MKWLIYLLLLFPSLSFGQIFNLRYSYTEICSEQQKRITIPLDLSGKNTLAFFGYSRTFASESGDVDLNQPIVIMSADFGYRNGGVITTSGGYNQTNLKTGMARGLLLTAGTDYVGNIGYFRVNPISKKTSTLINTNILLLQQSVVGNLTFGLLGDLGWAGSYFGFYEYDIQLYLQSKGI